MVSLVDTWGGLRQLALSANQSFSPTFIRDLLKRRGGVSLRSKSSPTMFHSRLKLTTNQALAVTLSLLPPLAINTTLGFLLFSSHSLFSLALARLPVFRRHLDNPVAEMTGTNPGRHVLRHGQRIAPDDDFANVEEQDYEEHHLTLQTLLQGPSFIPRHPTILSAIAGAGAGIIQGIAFTPIENIVR